MFLDVISYFHHNVETNVYEKYIESLLILPRDHLKLIQWFLNLMNI